LAIPIVKLTFTIGAQMTDLTLSTLAFTFITFVAVLVLMVFTRRNNRIAKTSESDILSNKNDELTTQLAHHKDENSTLMASIAAKDASLVYFQTIEEKVENSQLQLGELREDLSSLKSTNSRLDGQVDEKSLVILQFKADLKTEKAQNQQHQQEVQSLGNINAELTEKLNQLDDLRSELAIAKTLLISKDELLSDLKSQLAADQESQKSLQEKIELLERSEKRLVTEFENAANKIFKEKTGEFSNQSKTSLDALLSPLKDQIGHFSKQVTDVYATEAKERHALQHEVHGLKTLNEQMSKEASALTKALKGDNKKQGTWGEVVLDRVLQDSGLRKGKEYETQVALKDAGGSNLKPDVVVHLPGNKDVVIDSKMTLTAYERYYNAEDDISRQHALKEHINSIKQHIKLLSAKNYHDLLGIKTLDYVLMFIPVEPAFNAAMEHDSGLVQLALKKNIMLVSPTNLMVALKTISNMWRVEDQNQNAQEIAKKAGDIFDKLVGFVDDMKKLGTHIHRAEGSYSDAMKKLSEGRGSLISKAEKMRELRIGNNKALPADLVDHTENFDLAAKS
jgi:DNA recombination protein RmuC